MQGQTRPGLLASMAPSCSFELLFGLEVEIQVFYFLIYVHLLCAILFCMGLSVVVVVVVTTPRSGSFPYFRTVRGVLPAKDNGSYADPPFEAPLSGSIVFLPSNPPL